MEAKLDRVGRNTKALQVTLDEDDIAAIDNWRKEQPGIPPRGSVIRHFFRKGLGSVGLGPSAAQSGS
ncbi:hypothetical protein [Azospirillum sp.]|uniref:hypothetical protein n=1 Tax=Azospirillum sp. TaxID=34012 RepID=UPI003D74A356